MAYCAHCGSDISNDSNFCPYCGKSVLPGRHQGNSSKGQSSEWDRYKTPRAMSFEPRDIDENRYMAILAYLNVLVIIPLLIRGYSPYVRYHCNQGLALLIVTIAIAVAANIIPFLVWIISAVGSLFVLLCIVIGVLNALNGRTTPLPIIGNMNII